MRALVGIVLTLGLLLSSVSGVAAQESSTGIVPGLNEPVAYADEDGITATLTVNTVHDNFEDYPERSEPEYGYRYVLVDFTVRNDGELSADVGVAAFSILSDHGRSHHAEFMEPEADQFNVIVDDLTLSAGESVDAALVFQVPTHAQPAFFSWVWSTDYQVLVDLGAEPQENSAFATGPDSAAVYTDEFGNPVASMQVTSIDTDLEGYSAAADAEEGDSFAGANITITNLTDRDVHVSAFRFSVLDSSGNFWDSSYLRADEGVEPEPFRGDLYLAPGESVEVMIAFNITGASELVGVRWMPKWSDTTIHFLEEQVGQVSATPQATPAGD